MKGPKSPSREMRVPRCIISSFSRWIVFHCLPILFRPALVGGVSFAGSSLAFSVGLCPGHLPSCTPYEYSSIRAVDGGPKCPDRTPPKAAAAAVGVVVSHLGYVW